MNAAYMALLQAAERMLDEAADLEFGGEGDEGNDPGPRWTEAERDLRKAVDDAQREAIAFDRNRPPRSLPPSAVLTEGASPSDYGPAQHGPWRCDACGAIEPAEHVTCSVCAERDADPSLFEHGGPAGVARPPAMPDPEVLAAENPAALSNEEKDRRGGMERVGALWRCVVCGGWNPSHVKACASKFHPKEGGAR